MRHSWSCVVSWTVVTLLFGATHAVGQRSAQVPEPLTLVGHEGRVDGLAFTSDGKRLVTGGRDQTIKIWDLTTGQALQTLKGHGGLIWSVACSLDGKRLASGSNDGTVKLWDLASGSATHTMQGFGYRVSAVAFSPDGMRLASGGDG